MFRFRLEPVRRLHESRRDELRAELADAHSAAEVLREQRQAVEEEIAGVRGAQTAALGAQSMDVTQVIDAQRYELVLRGQLQAIAEKADLVEEEIERRRQAVAAAEQSVKTYDKLETRQAEAHRVEAERHEAKQMDDIALMAYGRRTHTAGASPPEPDHP